MSTTPTPSATPRPLISVSLSREDWQAVLKVPGVPGWVVKKINAALNA